MLLLCRLVASLPLAAVHSLGALIARIAFAVAGGERRRLDENLRRAGYGDPALRRSVIEESGKTLLELPWIWLRPQEEIVKLVRDVVNPEVFLQAKERGKGIIFLTPHLGCFEASAQFANNWPREGQTRPTRPYAELVYNEGSVYIFELK